MSFTKVSTLIKTDESERDSVLSRRLHSDREEIQSVTSCGGVVGLGLEYCVMVDTSLAVQMFVSAAVLTLHTCLQLQKYCKCNKTSPTLIYC